MSDRVPPPPPTPVVLNKYTPEELAVFEHHGLDVKDYAVVVAPAITGGIGFTDMPTPEGVKRFLMVQVAVPIPPDLLPPDTGMLTDPKTNQPMLSKRLREAFVQGMPQMLRTIVKRTSLAPDVQVMIQAQEHAAAQRAEAPAPPLPFLRPNPEGAEG